MFFKAFVFTVLLAFAASAELYYSASPYYGAAPIIQSGYYARSPAVLPLVYSRIQGAAPALETYNSVQTPDSFQQQYRSDYKPYSYEYVY